MRSEGAAARTIRDPQTFERLSLIARTPFFGTPLATLLPGTSVHGGRYRIEEVLGSGGEGVVYRAIETERRQPVALKVLHVEDPSAIPRLKREFRFLRGLVHRALVPLHELVVERELSFYSMGLVEGGNFLELATDESSLRRQLFQLAEVLDFLHAAGRVHRDVKPSNVLVRADGQVVLVDFGIALDLNAQGTGETWGVGTPRYIAPEVMKSGRVTPRADSYSVGVMLYEALTGCHPEPSGHTNPHRKDAPRPRQLRPDISEELDDACARLLEPDPDKRLDMVGLLHCLAPERAQSGDSPGETAPSWPPSSSTWGYKGRTREMDCLNEARRRVVELGEPVLVLLEAASGLGKTATLREFTRQHPDALILRGHCSEHELVAHKAIDGLIDDLVHYLLSLDPSSLNALVPPSEAWMLAQLFPELSRIALPSHEPNGEFNTADTRAARGRAYQASAAIFRRLAEKRELILIIDDLQWGDLDSAKLLQEVFSSEQRPHCLMVLAYRTEERLRSPCLKELLVGDRRLHEAMVTTQIRLLPLDRRESAQVIEQVAGLKETQLEALGPWIRRITLEAKGSPLLLTELGSELRRQLSTGWVPGAPDDPLEPLLFGIEGIVQDRTKRLSPLGQEAWRMLCCSNGRISARLLARLLQTDPAQLIHELEAERLGRLRTGGNEVEVLHDALREAELQRLVRRAELHDRIAHALEADGGDPAEIARHYAASGDEIRASHWAETGADAAHRSFALDQAIHLYRIALRGLVPTDERRTRLVEKLAGALAATGLGGEAAALYAELASLASPQRAIEFRRRAAEQWLIIGAAALGSEQIARVQREVGLNWPETPKSALRTLLWERFRVALRQPRAKPQARATDTRSFEQLEACRAAWSFGFISTIHGAANASRYLRLALSNGDREHIAWAYGMEAIYLATAGARAAPRAWAAFAQCEKATPDDPRSYSRAYLHFVRAHCHYLMGEPREALPAYENAEREFLSRCQYVLWERSSARIFWANSLWEVGQHRELDRAYESWLADAEERGDLYLGAAIGVARARRTILRNGNYEEAIDQIDRGAALWVSPYLGFHHFAELITRADVAIATARPHEAHQIMLEGARKLKVSLMGRVQVPRMHFRTYLAYTAIELAADARAPTERRRYLAIARHEAQKMRREQAPYATARAELLTASIALLLSPNAAGVARLEATRDAFAALGHELYARAVDARLGELLGGEEGRLLLERARDAFRAADCCDWTRALSCFAPRFLPA